MLFVDTIKIKKKFRATVTWFILLRSPSSLCSRVCFINFRFILYLYKRTLQFGQQIGKQISSRRSRARVLNPRRVQFNWKKVNSRRYQRAIKKDRTSARAEQWSVCHKSTKSTVWRARLVHVSAPRVIDFIIKAEAANRAFPFHHPRSRPWHGLISRWFSMVMSLELFAVYIKVSNNRGIFSHAFM